MLWTILIILLFTIVLYCVMASTEEYEEGYHGYGRRWGWGRRLGGWGRRWGWPRWGRRFWWPRYYYGGPYRNIWRSMYYW